MVQRPRTSRQRAIAKALTSLLPIAPFADMEKIRADALGATYRTLPPTIAVWLATVAHIRHAHTDYDALLFDGYDRESARHFVLDDINNVLGNWRSKRLLDAADEDI